MVFRKFLPPYQNENWVCEKNCEGRQKNQDFCCSIFHIFLSDQPGEPDESSSSDGPEKEIPERNVNLVIEPHKIDVSPEKSEHETDEPDDLKKILCEVHYLVILRP